VSADGCAVLKASELVDETADLTAEPAHPWVGRGALKLTHALDVWKIDPTGLTVLDVGASTGGFTEVLLSRGARRVFAVDVGRGQLHPRLAADPRVVSLEGVDARDLHAGLIDEAPQLITADVSFISLAKALPRALALGAPASRLIALVKPQFEAGPELVGKGGQVRDPQVHAQVLADVSAFLTTHGWRVIETTQSPIRGGAGAREHLLLAVRS
jgi:23S rRNA (cytidine1920-2'-O)/16S rRNA (cytidine1409-2'-O)-methyltransferase